MTATPARKTGSSGLHARYEKAGLVLDTLPIPWNADAVLVEALVRLPTQAPRDRQHFTLQLSTGGETVAAEWVHQQDQDAAVRVSFRIAHPRQGGAEVFWREHSLGRIDLPVLTRADFLHSLSLQMAVVHTSMQKHTVVCQTFVSTQCQSLICSALLSTTGPLAPVVDLDLRVEVQFEDDKIIASVPVHFTSGQLRNRQALLALLLPKLRRTGEYAVSWLLGSQQLHQQRIRAITKRKFLASLRVSGTRFLVQKQSGAMDVLRWLPQNKGELQLDDIARIGPCFFVSSNEIGMAGIAKFILQAVVNGQSTSPMAIEHEMLVTDGPMPLLAGTIDVSEVKRIKHFTLATSAGSLGVLPLFAAPTAQFTAEGGFEPLDDFLWSPAAEEQLDQRLGKLLGS